MIVSLEGELTEIHPLLATIEAQGLGYEVHLPLPTMDQLPPVGCRVKLFTHAVYREDSQTLYGFHQREDREFFRLLVEKVSGIGPKIALRIMSRLSVTVLKSAIGAADVALLSKCHGIGKKTAERLIIELKDKVGPEFAVESRTPFVPGTSSLTGADTRIQDAVAALMTLGYKAPDADKAVRKVMGKLPPDAPTEDLIKSALS